MRSGRGQTVSWRGFNFTFRPDKRGTTKWQITRVGVRITVPIAALFNF